MGPFNGDPVAEHRSDHVQFVPAQVIARTGGVGNGAVMLDERDASVGFETRFGEVALQAALVSLSRQDPELAWTYSDRVSDRQSIEHIRGMALKAMAETRPLDAIKLAQTAGNSEALLAGIARGWAITDDSAAEEWIASLPDPDLAARLRAATSE